MTTIKNYDFTGVCCNGCGCATPSIRNASAAALKAACEDKPIRFYCGCGAVMRLRCDGVSTERGGGVKIVNETPPAITSISTATGPVAGGTSVRVFGLNFSIQTPTVRFGGVASPNVQVLGDTQLDAILPAGKILVLVTNRSAPFQVGDMLRGQLSGAQARVVTAAPLAVNEIVGSFQPGETLRTDNGQTATLSSLNGTVDVEIEGPFGVHKISSKLAGAFTYE